MVRLVHHVSLTVEPEDVVPDAARSARLQFVFVSEEFLTSETTSVVETPVSKHTQQGAFTGVYVSHDCHPAVETEQSIYKLDSVYTAWKFMLALFVKFLLLDSRTEGPFARNVF